MESSSIDWWRRKWTREKNVFRKNEISLKFSVGSKWTLTRISFGGEGLWDKDGIKNQQKREREIKAFLHGEEGAWPTNFLLKVQVLTIYSLFLPFIFIMAAVDDYDFSTGKIQFIFHSNQITTPLFRVGNVFCFCGRWLAIIIQARELSSYPSDVIEENSVVFFEITIVASH